MSSYMDWKNKMSIQEYEAGNDVVLQEDLDYIANSSFSYEQLRDSVILVTGATGLVGVSLIRALLCVNRINKLNLHVLAFARNQEKAKRILGKLLLRNDLSLLIGDVNNEIKVTENVDYIFHCASVTASKTMVSHPVETILTSVEGTKNILYLAKEKKCQSVVYISSMEMYGALENDNVTEQELGYINPLALRSNYPESKRLCENMCVAFLSEYGVPVKIARLSQTFGAGVLAEENRVFAQFARSVLEKRDIILHTRGLSQGNYCYLRDTVLGLLYILIKGENGNAYNVSNPAAHTTIADMAQMVCDKIADGAIQVKFDIPADNRYGYAADTKIKLNADKLHALGWKPEVDLEEMYRRMIRSMETYVEE